MEMPRVHENETRYYSYNPIVRMVLPPEHETFLSLICFLLASSARTNELEFPHLRIGGTNEENKYDGFWLSV